jgi:hypothetical protein
MANGTAEYSSVTDVQSFADVINALQCTEALSVGSLKPELRASVSIVTVDMHAASPTCGTITRTRNNFEFPHAQGFMFLDYDPKTLSQGVKDKLTSMGDSSPPCSRSHPNLPAPPS